MATNSPLKQRIVGAVVLASLAVIFLPLVLETAPTSVMIGTNIPARPDGALDAVEFQLEASNDAEPEASEEVRSSLLKDFMHTLGLAEKVAVTPVSQKSNAEQAHTWMVQLATFSQEANAVALRDELRGKDFPTHVDKVATDDGTLWRVRVGPELSSAQAEAVSERLAKETGLKPMVVRIP